MPVYNIMPVSITTKKRVYVYYEQCLVSYRIYIIRYCMLLFLYDLKNEWIMR